MVGTLKKLTRLVAGPAAALLLVSSASAASSFSLQGDAQLQDGAIQLRSDADSTFGLVDYDVPSGLQFEDIDQLSTDYNVTDDDCGGGSPRFQINIGDKNVHVSIGPSPNFTGCEDGWQDSGNLIASPDARFDLTQFGGPFYGTYQQALDLIGDETVTGIQLVVDAGWFFSDGEQTILVRDVTINDDTFSGVGTPTAKDQCKNGGWKEFNNPSFKNQGQCVSYFNHQDDQDADDDQDDNGKNKKNKND